ncbi:MAG: type II toxin-antitoxin system HicB family antitoxin [Candidatus Helarchaeota archaeon]
MVPDDENGYVARCIELPGAISQGDTIEDAISNIKEAILLVLEDINKLKTKNEKIIKVEISV